MDTRDNPRRRMENRSVMEQATEWLMVLEDKGAEANPAFSDWLRESPTHVQAYLRATTLDTLLRRVDAERSIEIVKPSPGALPPDIEPQFAQRQPRAVWRMAAGFAAVGVVVALSWTVFKLTDDGWKNYRTNIGQQRTVELDDGSILTLNTDSRVQVRFTDSGRQLRLVNGEAAFRVARDPARPFLVHSGGSVIQAIGTEFNVYRKASETTVSVLEGRVAVLPSYTDKRTPEPGEVREQPVYLNAGEEVRLSAGGLAHSKAPVNVTKVLAWREHRLVFVDEPLASIAYEVNRYNRSPRIRVEADAGSRLYAVSLRANDPESLVAVLAEDPRIVVERRDEEIVIRRR